MLDSPLTKPVMRPFNFKPPLIPTIAAIAMIALTVSLGNWQLRRADEKRALQRSYEQAAAAAPVRLGAALVDPKQIIYRRVLATGEFEPRFEILVDNKVHNGVAGYHVVTPLRLMDSQVRVLVNRGWIAAGPDRRVIPNTPAPGGTVTIEGLAVVPTHKILEMSAQTQAGKVWQNLVLERYRAQVPFKIQPIVIEQLRPLKDGLVRSWRRPDTGIATHLGYAFQWYALAVAIVIIYIVVNVKRRNRANT